GPGDRATVGLTIHIPEGWHLWSLDPGPGPLPLKIKVVDGPIAFDGPWHGDAPEMKFDRGFKRELAQYEGGPVHLYRAIKVDPKAPPGPVDAKLLVDAQICSASLCIKDPATVSLKLNIHPSSTGIEPEALPGVLLTMAAAEPAVGANQGVGLAAAAVGSTEWLQKAKAQGLWRFILWAFAAGLLALATPCVFPAIPLTLSFFSKYSEESFSRSVRLAATYAGTMVAAFTVVGIVISIVFGATEVQRFSQHPFFNLFLGVVLVFFGLNLLGLFEIQVPSFVLRATNSLENRFGAGARLTGKGIASGWGDYIVVGIAALTATTVFFTCTVAFVGNVIVAAAGGEWFWPTIGMLAFGAAFALPFFLLALFPQAAQKMSRRSGGWLGATQVTLGFLELAAAAKFFSNVDLVWKWGFITREAVLALWVPLFALCGLFLLGKLAIGHKSLASPDGSVSVTQMLASMTMFALALYLAAGMFSGRSFPSWISAWLPPSTYPSAGAAGGPQLAAVNGVRFEWSHNLAEGRKRARAADQLVFVNYTGYTCTNCRFMEESIFPTPSVAAHLQRMALVELYTDDGSPSNEWARQDQLERFKTVALPFYSVEFADGTVVATYPGSADNAAQFAQFLADARARAVTMRPPSAPLPGGIQAASPSEPSPIRLVTTGLFSGQPTAAITPGKWNLVNFWATWCGPCKEELQSFMVRLGRDFEKKGGRFAVVAVEDEEGLATAQSFAQTIELPATSALRLPSEPSTDDVDPKFQFTGSLPLTVLISPQGKVVWRHAAKITEDELKAVIVEHLGHASL
ncbi:MAG: cytochrome c biogenesis protein CcdA, partial [Myxococcota bacterium]